MTKLTKRVIEGAENRDKPYFIFDEHLPGFCARIAPNGRRHYYAQYLRGKKTKRMPLGQHGIITTEQARDKAIAVMASVNDGNDPQAEKSQKRKEPTVADLAQRYMEEHVHVHCKPRTAQSCQQCIKSPCVQFRADKGELCYPTRSITFQHLNLPSQWIFKARGNRANIKALCPRL